MVFFAAPFLASCATARAAEPYYPVEGYQALKWRNIGPLRGGRSVAVAGNAKTPHTFYFGAAGGGVWKTTDGGQAWAPVSDKDFKMSSVGALAVAPSDPNVIYAGMGESFIRGDMLTGDGVYRSTDAGKTWQPAGLADTRVISQIVVDPRDPDHVYAAALGHVFGDNEERGVFRSEDGGKNWKKILYKDAQTGAADLAMDPGNPRVLYAALWQAHRKPWTFESGGPGSGLYKSTDGGDTWTELSRNPGMPKEGPLGRIGVAVSGASSSVVYAMVEAKEGGVFRSDDGGETWRRTHSDNQLRQRAWYYTRIYAHPADANTVYAPQVEGVFMSTDGGASFKPLKTPHADRHVMWINPDKPDIMVVGDDGGGTISYNGGRSWSAQDFPTAQFYHVAVDDRFPYHVYGAQQDNTPVGVASRTQGAGISAKDWYVAAGGESGYVVPDPRNPDVTYGGSYGGHLVRYDRAADRRERINVWPDNPMGHGAADLKYRFQWTFPIAVSPHDARVLYAAAQHVFVSDSEGRGWKRISPDLTRNDKSKQQQPGGPITKDSTSIEYYGTVFALAESPVEKGLLWAGSDDGLVHVSRDGGNNWTKVTPRALPEWATVSIIEPSRFNAGTAYLAAHRYRLDDFHTYLFKTEDYGEHWQAIAGGIPENEAAFVIREDTAREGLLYAGTERGVYVSFDGGSRWQSLQLKLPRAPVWDMAVQARENDLVIATHGRSFWIMDNLEVLRQLEPQLAKAPAHLFEPEPVWLFGGATPAEPAPGLGENPPDGAVIHYLLKEPPAEKGKIKLEILTAGDEPIASFTDIKTPEDEKEEKALAEADKFNPDPKKPRPKVLDTMPGMNRFVWDLHYPDAAKVPEAVLWAGDLEGPQVPPGTYRLRLTVGEQVYAQPLTVKADPRLPNPADLQARFDLVREIHRKLDETHKAILRLRAVRTQTNAVLKRLDKHAAIARLKDLSKPLLDGLTQSEEALIQTKSKAPQDPLNHPIRLNNKLAALIGVVEATAGAPTPAQREVFADLAAQVGEQLRALEALYAKEARDFSAAVAELALPPLDLAPAP